MPPRNINPDSVTTLGNPHELQELYWGGQLTLDEIAKKKNCSEATVLNRMKVFGIPRRSKSEDHKLRFLKHRTPYINKANLSPSPELAYVVGACLGDGSVSHSGNSYSICLRCKDKDFAEFFHKCLEKILKHANPIFYWDKRLYQASGHSKQLYEFLKKNSLEIAELFPAEFIRGLMDSDGSGFYYHDKYHRRPFVRISLDNINLGLLKYTKDLLWRKFGIESKIYDGGIRNGPIKGRHVIARRPIYKLFILKRASVAKFASEIGFNIKRKQDKLKEGMELAEYA